MGVEGMNGICLTRIKLTGLVTSKQNLHRNVKRNKSASQLKIKSKLKWCDVKQSNENYEILPAPMPFKHFKFGFGAKFLVENRCVLRGGGVTLKVG